MKLLFFINTLAGGGAERVLVNLTSVLNERGHEVIIATNIDKKIYSIDSGIEIITPPQRNWYTGRNLIKRIIRNYKRKLQDYKFTRDAIRETNPDYIITFLHCNMLSILRFHGNIPIIHSEHNAYDRKLGYDIRFRRFFINRFFNKVCVLTPFDQGFAIAKGLKNTIVMPNPNSYNPITADTYSSLFHQRHNIMVCGRVSAWHVKGMDLAIDAFSKIANKIPTEELHFVGGYDEFSKTHLENMAKAKGVADRVKFLGQVTNIDELMKQYKLFLLSSRTEGFPMVITEAMTQGLPCVSFEKLANSIISSNYDGLLVMENQNTQQLANALLQTITNDEFRYNIGYNALQTVCCFSKDNVANRWEALFHSLK